MSVSGKPLDPNAPANPCGNQAKFIFTDSYAFKFGNGSMIPLKDWNVIWYGSESGHYKNLKDDDWADKQILNKTDCMSLLLPSLEWFI